MAGPALRSRHEWRELVDEFEQSGLAVGEFAALRGVSPRTLGWWRWKFGGESFVAGFAEVAIEHRPSSAFLEPTTVEVELTNGVRLRFGYALDPQGLETLASVFAGVVG